MHQANCTFRLKTEEQELAIRVQGLVDAQRRHQEQAIHYEEKATQAAETFKGIMSRLQIEKASLYEYIQEQKNLLKQLNQEVVRTTADISALQAKKQSQGLIIEESKIKAKATELEEQEDKLNSSIATLNKLTQQLDDLTQGKRNQPDGGEMKKDMAVYENLQRDISQLEQQRNALQADLAKLHWYSKIVEKIQSLQSTQGKDAEVVLLSKREYEEYHTKFHEIQRKYSNAVQQLKVCNLLHISMTVQGKTTSLAC
jgi:hypothetical protein